MVSLACVQCGALFEGDPDGDLACAACEATLVDTVSCIECGCDTRSDEKVVCCGEAWCADCFEAHTARDHRGAA